MDSKYSIFSKNKTNLSDSSPFSQNLKRKFSYGSPSSVPPAAKKPNLQNDTKPSNASLKQNINQNGASTNKSAVADIQMQRRRLPVFAVRDQLLGFLRKNHTLIVIGETGSGKTTQIPQFLLEIGQSAIAVTQPRRVAAISISTRVAKEMKCKLGETVGYTVRFEDMTSKKTKIRFLTDGSLLREAMSDRLLMQYSTIILDEAHERTINTDILFGIVKAAQKQRVAQNKHPLKIIIMSATMDVDHFSSYFNNCKTVYLEGRTYPIKIMHVKETQSDYLYAVMSTLFKIHQEAPPNHDILVFLTGQEEIESMAHQIKSMTKSNSLKGPILRVFPLYAQLAQNRQMDVFMPSGLNTRKIILSTNIAETSLTIPGIKYVIDSGAVKRRVYDSKTGMDTLKVRKISQDQAWQRCGRAGRESEGFCYRTYTFNEYKQMPITTTPEILRSNIAATVLQLMSLGIDCRKFDFIDSPDAQSIELALNQLVALGAVSIGKQTELTELGRKMAKFPLDPKYSKILLMAPQFGCLEEVLSIVALLSGEDVFINNIHDTDRRGDALVAHAKFENEFGDHLTLLNVFKAFAKAERPKIWSHDNFLNIRNLGYALEVRNQLSEICKRVNLEFESCGNKFDQVRKCLLSGLFINIAELQRDNHYLTLTNRQRAKIHPSSVLNGKSTAKYILFTELVATGKTYMRTVTQIDPEWIDEVVPNIQQLKKLFKISDTS
ncbi:ATP-dependent RNA helicase DHX33 [Sitodiplosis mosellana]|uniref:ATP-dependent RNA helicase DHX33 n=1 Tax=Sitodiplosis mosellana TaxID=263140 RepID=UPI0024447942|nr:ATP-dependent RNA helicase DHX33 [Sitodiplosis mosellana]